MLRLQLWHTARRLPSGTLYATQSAASRNSAAEVVRQRGDHVESEDLVAKSATTGSATQLAGDLWLLDTRFQGAPGVIASYLLIGTHGLALIDTGPGSTLPQLLAAVHAAGFEPRAIEHLIVTHVHLDHAGAAGQLAHLLPQARVCVHERGAPHLADPSKLMASASRIYGERMPSLWGEMLPVPAQRLVALRDGARLEVGNRTLEAVYTPGHAVHHIALHDAERGDLFAGDVAGVRLQGVGFVRPPTPPPDLSLEDWYTSLHRIEALRPQALYLGHFGLVRDVPEHLSQLRRRLGMWGELTLAGLRRGDADEALAATLERASRDELRHASPAGSEDETVRRYEVSSNYLMSAQGYARYWRRYHPEALQ